MLDLEGLGKLYLERKTDEYEKSNRKMNVWAKDLRSFIWKQKMWEKFLLFNLSGHQAWFGRNVTNRWCCTNLGRQEEMRCWNVDAVRSEKKYIKGVQQCYMKGNIRRQKKTIWTYNYNGIHTESKEEKKKAFDLLNFRHCLKWESSAIVKKIHRWVDFNLVYSI